MKTLATESKRRGGRPRAGQNPAPRAWERDYMMEVLDVERLFTEGERVVILKEARRWTSKQIRAQIFDLRTGRVRLTPEEILTALAMVPGVERFRGGVVYMDERKRPGARGYPEGLAIAKRLAELWLRRKFGDRWRDTSDEDRHLAIANQLADWGVIRKGDCPTLDTYSRSRRALGLDALGVDFEILRSIEKA